LAIDFLPLLYKPVKKTVNPCLNLGGYASLKTFTTSGYENHSGIGKPSFNLLRSSKQKIKVEYYLFR
jgi:hypothetical protein